MRAKPALSSGPASFSVKGGGDADPRWSVPATFRDGVLELAVPAGAPPGDYMLSVRAQGSTTFPCFAERCTARLTAKWIHEVVLGE